MVKHKNFFPNTKYAFHAPGCGIDKEKWGWFKEIIEKDGREFAVVQMAHTDEVVHYETSILNAYLEIDVLRPICGLCNQPTTDLKSCLFTHKDKVHG